MVFNGATVVAVADISTDTWQQLWRVPEPVRINTEQLLELAFRFSTHQLSRLVLRLWSFMCLPSSDSFYSYTYESISPSSSDDDDDDDDQLSFDHNRYRYHDYYDDRSASSSSSIIEFDDYYPYSNSD